ncbi:hypothetical protein C7120_07610 [Prevotella sp. oral taxon 376]|uniref:DUF4837 family protein n=1 Tax=Prevotella sp. oral taxon 376 TaxID=712466 RepID=UPI000D1E27E5|nr:DUF4837 family protein [Prevotella sp. oral taxon 376]PTL34385.1 hypothetical protein C7120_07610 [Prevotella sp. oral taxon 376]
MNKLLPALTTLLLLAACGGRKPAEHAMSSMKPYEVLVVGDSADAIADCLGRPCRELPQGEPMYDVVSISPKDFRGSYRLARTVVIYTKGTRHDWDIKDNVYTRPQRVVYANKDNILIAEAFIEQFEHQQAVKQLRRKHNPKAGALVKKMFGEDIRIPADMKASKQGKDFLWLSDNGTLATKNLVVMRLRGQCPYYHLGDFLGPAFKAFPEVLQRVDSCLGANIRGEADDMRMRMNASTVMTRQDKMLDLHFHGLWEMENDIMGGPFFARLTNRRDGTMLVELAFVYAPGQKKRNLIRQLEAVVYDY